MKRYFFYLKFLCVLLHLLNVNYFAQNEEDSVVTEIGSILNLEVSEEKYISSSSKYNQTPHDVPPSITNVTAEEFKAHGYQTLNHGLDVCGQKSKLPVEVQFKIIPKILLLNKNLYDYIGSEYVNISVLYSQEQRGSQKVFESLFKNVNENELRIKNHKVRLHPIELSFMHKLEEFITLNDIDLLYITPLCGVNISEITKICKKAKVLTFTGVEEFVSDNVSVIIGLNENKPKIIINRDSSQQEGANFSSKLLKIAKLIN